MKMKNYKSFATTALFTMLIIGLLVITGCSDLFQPPIKTAGNGNGILSVSVNGADSRTILPAARLDKYELALSVLTGTAYTAYNGAYPKELQGTIAFELPPGTYKVAVEGYVGGKVVADGEEEGIVVTADDSASISIILEPYAGGKGTFSWDFDVGGVTATAITIYDVDDAATAVKTSTDKAGDFELDAGVYSVKFAVTAFSKEHVWWEILYIYNDLTSVYGNSNLIIREVVPSIYDTPVGGPGYFYLDLNNWQTQTPESASINHAVPEGTLAADKLTLTFLGPRPEGAPEKDPDGNNQRVNIKLTSDQIEILLARSGAIKITIEGSAVAIDDKGEEVDSTTNFRYHLGNALTGQNWNATSGSGDGLFSAILTGEQTFTGNKSAETLGYFILQQRAAVSHKVTIDSIRIDYPIYIVPTATGDAFYLDLNDWKTTTPESANINSTLPAGTLTADSLALTFTENNQRVNIGLTGAQIAALQNSSDVKITVWGSGGAAEVNFRYHIGDATTGSDWNVTGGSGEKPFSELASAAGITTDASINADRLDKIKHFILQHRKGEVTTNITINKVLFEYESKAEVLPDDGTVLENLNNINGIMGAGSPVYKLRADGGLYVGNRTSDYFAIDLQVVSKDKPPAAGETGLDVTKSYRVTVKGKAVAAAGTTAEINLGQRPWSGLASKPLTEFGDVGKIVSFIVEVTKTGEEILTQTTTDGSPSTLTNAPRIRVHNASSNPDFIIDSVELIEVDAQNAAVGSALIAFNVPEVLDLTGTDVANLDSYSGIQLAGNPKFKKTAGNGLLVYDRPNDYSTIDLQIFAEANSEQPWRVIVDGTKSYKLTVKGTAVALYGQSAQIVQGGNPYGTHAQAPLTNFGDVNTTVDFEVIATKTGAEFLTPNTRIRVSGTQSFIITSIELIEVNAQGEAVGTALVNLTSF